LLFAKGILLVEGDAEQIMIPAMLRAVFGVTPDELGFSVITMSSAFFEHVAVIFTEDRIRRPCAIVTDLDKAFIALPVNKKNDNKYQSHARAAERSGEFRRKSIRRLVKGNRWIRAFFANHTFEVDFIKAGNSWEAIQTLDSIYSQAPSKRLSQTKLESDDLQISGVEILRLAEKLGKGWFALLLSEKIFRRTYIPKYILCAVAFACQSSISENMLKQMGIFRLKADGQDEDLINALPPLAELQNLSPTVFISTFCKAAPTDAFSLFCQYLEEYRGE
jgi:putative ATP-dependent endonuclease of the OLD family